MYPNWLSDQNIFRFLIIIITFTFVSNNHDVSSGLWKQHPNRWSQFCPRPLCFSLYAPSTIDSTPGSHSDPLKLKSYSDSSLLKILQCLLISLQRIKNTKSLQWSGRLYMSCPFPPATSELFFTTLSLDHSRHTPALLCMQSPMQTPASRCLQLLVST